MTDDAANDPKHRFRVIDLDVDLDRETVSRAKQAIDLPELSFRLFAALIRHAPHKVSKDELITEVWDGVVVSDETLAQRVRLLRQALGEDSQNPRYFSSVRGRGYRMICDVKPLGEAASRGKTKHGLIAAVLLAIAALLFFNNLQDGSPPAPSENSIAVLPFVNMSDDASNEYFSDGISEELLNLLAKIPELRVAARTSSFFYKDKLDTITLAEVAQQLGVAHILEGSVRKSGNRVRITLQLIKADDGFHLWSETYDRTLDDIFLVQDEIASEVAQALEVTLIGKSQADRMIDSEAYVLFLRGLHFLLQRGAENLKKSEEALLQAIELEPGYAKAWSLLAVNYYEQTNRKLKTREDGAALAKTAIERAKSLNPDLGVVWGVDGFLKKNLDWDWSAAHAAINKAYELEPKNNPIRTWRASMASTIGKLDDALELCEQAFLNDPLNLSAHSALGIAYTKVHRYDEATVIFEKQAELKPDYHWAYFNLSKTYLFRGDAEQALLEIKKNPENVFRNVGLVMAYSTLGLEAEAEEALKRLVSEYGTQNPIWIAEAYSWRGQKDEAFEWLDKAFMQGDFGLSYILGNNVFYSLTGDPRWVGLLKKMNLLEYWRAMPPEYGGPTNAPG